MGAIRFLSSQAINSAFSGLTAGPPMGRRASDCGAYSTLLAAKLIERNGGQRIYQAKMRKVVFVGLFYSPYTRVGIKKPTQKNPPKKTQKNPPKKSTKNSFFGFF
jgi:hypothetical protein